MATSSFLGTHLRITAKAVATKVQLPPPPPHRYCALNRTIKPSRPLLMVSRGTMMGKMGMSTFTCCNNAFGHSMEESDDRISSDIYDKIRMAWKSDCSEIKEMLQRFEPSVSLVVGRSDEELLEMISLGYFFVVERARQIIACAALVPFLEEKCGEIAAMVVACDYHGQGHAEKLLDYIENKASSDRGLERLFLISTSFPDWFIYRGYSECSIESIPEKRRTKINVSRFKYHEKQLIPKWNLCRILSTWFQSIRFKFM